MKTYQDLNNRHEFMELKAKLSEIVSDHVCAIMHKLEQLETGSVRTEDCEVQLISKDWLHFRNSKYSKNIKYCDDLKTDVMIEFLSVVGQVVEALDALESEKCKDLQAALYKAIDLVCDKDEIEEEDEQ